MGSSVSVSPRSTPFDSTLPPRALIGFATAIFAVVVIAFFSWGSLQAREESDLRVAHTFQVLEQLESVASAMKDAETGQRGFLLTGTDSYLQPYLIAEAQLPNELTTLKDLVSDNPAQRQLFARLEAATSRKMTELAETIEVRRAGNVDGALALVRTDRGKLAMDEVRALVSQMKTQERQLLNARQLAAKRASELSSLLTWGGSALLLFLISVAGLMTARDHRAREIEVWLRTGQMDLGERMQGGLRVETLGENMLAFFAKYLDARVGSVYIGEDGNHLRRVSGYALPAGAAGELLRTGDGLLGQAVKDRRTLHVQKLPADYIPVSSSLGQGKPEQLLIAPAVAEGDLHAVIELGFLHRLHPAELELMSRASETVAVAVRTAKDRSRLEDLLEETQRQAEELQSQQEELRVTNEELEQQSVMLREQQANLELQQSELEQTNTHLEEHTQLLAREKSQVQISKEELAAKAKELEAASRYKSEFLANMSHELRTPLNSTLILAKLLADNRDGNLSSDQVKYAQSISAAGNDLLELINDILDLSKIEAGMMDVRVEPLRLSHLAEIMTQAFQATSREKRLAFSVSVEPGAPESIVTDQQRLRQILKNLLANALKFTDKGQVSLTIRGTENGRIQFAVKDTGIGIARSQRVLIFEAFRQAEGGSNRKYGGTGLGLSISRDLARLLGGDVVVESEVGVGSTFTLELPSQFEAKNAKAPAIEPRAEPFALESSLARPRARFDASRASSSPPPAREHLVKPLNFEDDRELCFPNGRTLLIVEDDPAFAKILLDLGRSVDFKGLVAQTADDAVALAQQYVPSAVLLDLGLPDHSGLTVLDRLKRSPQTRHIPVQVVSASDARQTVLEMGAAGYMLKPVDRGQVLEALKKLESKFSQPLRSVLVVEDDPVQRDSICRLLETGDVRTVPVESAEEALEHLAAATYDCVVLDLSLTGPSGYDLLEKMAKDEAYSFPPVIIYTGRSLSSADEQILRRYSESIIIKGARSPERLLDEVTLFLHQVETKLPPERQRMLAEARHHEADFDGRRVLLVEDDVRNVFALSTVLEQKGIKLRIARNGREGVEAVEREPDLDLVLMDIMMPEMDGLEAMRQIRARKDATRLPIIALTAKAMRDDQEQCIQAGANDYIAKPIDVEKLLTLMRVWMSRKR